MSAQLKLAFGAPRTWRRPQTIAQLARRSGDRTPAGAQHLHRNPNTTNKENQ